MFVSYWSFQPVISNNPSLLHQWLLLYSFERCLTSVDICAVQERMVFCKRSDCLQCLQSWHVPNKCFWRHTSALMQQGEFSGRMCTYGVQSSGRECYFFTDAPWLMIVQQCTDIESQCCETYKIKYSAKFQSYIPSLMMAATYTCHTVCFNMRNGPLFMPCCIYIRHVHAMHREQLRPMPGSCKQRECGIIVV